MLHRERQVRVACGHSTGRNSNDLLSRSAVPKHCRAGGHLSFSQQTGQGNKAHLGLSLTPSQQGTMARNMSENGAVYNMGLRSIQRPWRRAELPRTSDGGGLGFNGAPGPTGAGHRWRFKLRMVRAIKACWCT